MGERCGMPSPRFQGKVALISNPLVVELLISITALWSTWCGSGVLRHLIRSAHRASTSIGVTARVTEHAPSPYCGQLPSRFAGGVGPVDHRERRRLTPAVPDYTRGQQGREFVRRASEARGVPHRNEPASNESRRRPENCSEASCPDWDLTNCGEPGSENEPARVRCGGRQCSERGGMGRLRSRWVRPGQAGTATLTGRFS